MRSLSSSNWRAGQTARLECAFFDFLVHVVRRQEWLDGRVQAGANLGAFLRPSLFRVLRRISEHKETRNRRQCTQCFRNDLVPLLLDG
jgi:predicted DNA-binding ribbon-helix-helix protein